MENTKPENPFLDLNIMDKSCSLLILAAGLGSRYKGQKQVDALTDKGETLMDFALFDALKVGIKHFVFVVNDQFPTTYQTRLKQNLTAHNAKVDFVEQRIDKFIPKTFQEQLKNRSKPLGTAHAVYCAKELIHNSFITVNADDFYGHQTFKKAFDYMQQGAINRKQFAMIAFRLKNTLSANGSVSRGICRVEAKSLQKVEEFTKIEKEEERILGRDEELKKHSLSGSMPVSMNFWILHPSFFEMARVGLMNFLEQTDISAEKECYLPSLINDNIQSQQLSVEVLPTVEQWFGLTYPEDRKEGVDHIKQLKSAGNYPPQLWP